ncbi:MAG: hypothetical protein Q7J57_00530 [Gemmobacter sp.]|nr:hypothetical protein [Gemmobacter sp.]
MAGTDSGKTAPVLQVQDLTIDYDGRGALTRAVDDVSFALEQGGFWEPSGTSGRASRPSLSRR